MEPKGTAHEELESLAGYRHCTARIRAAWPGFLARRAERLQPHLFGNTPEKITETILEDLFTHVLDWPLSGFNPQVNFADIVLSDLSIRWLVVEAKRPNSLARSRREVELAISQATRYADEQHVKKVAVSDGLMLYAADIESGGLRNRLLVSLAAEEPQLDLWWLSVDGIHRPHELPEGTIAQLLPEEPAASTTAVDSMPPDGNGLLHPTYHIPARCFAYVGNYADPHSWSLPYLREDGTVDTSRLPKAIQCILTNYRGARVRSIPEEAIPDVLARLARAATRTGRFPPSANSAQVYRELAAALDQLKNIQNRG